MGSVIPNIDAVYAAAVKDIDDLAVRIGTNIKTIVIEADTMLKALTPVWSGQAVRNYIWTTDIPFAGVYEAIDSGPTGHTNSMPLGAEPRRPANEAAAAESLVAVNIGNPFQNFICRNNSPDIEGLELGLLPEPPLKSRSPNGMFVLVDTFIKAQIATKGVM